jgi:hypothetical protein
MEYIPLALFPGVILSQGKVLMYAMKIRLEGRNDEVFYLGYDRIVELARALARKTDSLYAQGKYSTENSSPETLATEKRYRQEIIALTQSEITEPDVNKVVHQLNAVIRDESVLLSITQHNKKTIGLCIPDAAVEIFNGYMLNSLLKAGGEEFLGKVLADIQPSVEENMDEGMVNIPVSLCVFSGSTQTTYDVNTGIAADSAYHNLQNAYIAGIREKNGKITAACVFVSSLADRTSPRMAEIVYTIFDSHNPTKEFTKHIASLPLSKLNINLKNGSLKQAFSDSELTMLYADFFFKYSVEGNG